MVKKTPTTEVKGKSIKWGESYISLLLGLVVVIIVIVIIISLGKNRRIEDTSSIQDGPVNKIKEVKDALKKAKSIETYVVKKGDYLWDIALKIYGDGYKWTDIARENNLANPDFIFSDDVLKIPRD